MFLWFSFCRFSFGADHDDSDPREYLEHVMKSTNMSCLTPEGALSGECDFLSANMYARSLFGMAVSLAVFVDDGLLSSDVIGEDALANLSVERTEAGTITGHVRIRSKTQGIALSLGDRITMGMFVFDSLLYSGVLILLLGGIAQKDHKPLAI